MKLGSNFRTKFETSIKKKHQNKEKLNSSDESNTVRISKTSKMGKAVGIDLGTTYSCVGVFQHGKVDIIANGNGNRTTPSYVAFNDTERLIGDAAKNQAAMNPSNTIFDAKRLIGRNYIDPTVQSDMKLWPFKVTSQAGKPKIEVGVIINNK